MWRLSALSSKDENNPGERYVTVGRCQRTHGDVTNQMSNLQTSVNQIVNTLLGEQKPGTLERSPGLVEDIRDIKTKLKNRWSPKEKATILASALTALAAILVAILK